MMTTRMELEAPLQALVDSRLDALDAILLQAGVSRGERAGIVEEVESQVHELLSRRTAGAPTRNDVLAVLASLDPPEAYAPEGYRQRLAVVAGAADDRRRVPQPCLLAVGAAIGGVLNLLVGALLLQLLEEEVLQLLLVALFCVGIPIAVTAGGILSIRRIRRSQGWLFGLPAALFAALLFPLLWLNGLLVAVVVVFEEAGLFVALGLAVLAANAYLIYHVWRSVSTGYRRELPVPEPH